MLRLNWPKERPPALLGGSWAAAREKAWSEVVKMHNRYKVGNSARGGSQSVPCHRLFAVAIRGHRDGASLRQITRSDRIRSMEHERVGFDA
jgi:hypothetical protein